jgi:hypothetical protein
MEGMPPGSNVEWGEIYPPDGRATENEPHRELSEALTTPEKAKEVASTALANPNSEVRRKNISHQAQLLDDPSLPVFGGTPTRPLSG